MYLSDNPYYLNKNLVIIGQVCDAEKRIHIILYQLESISCLFNSATLLHLQLWSLEKPSNCTQISFKPENKNQMKDWSSIKTLNELINILLQIIYH